jgi:hypothetical protein
VIVCQDDGDGVPQEGLAVDLAGRKLDASYGTDGRGPALADDSIAHVKEKNDGVLAVELRNVLACLGDFVGAQERGPVDGIGDTRRCGIVSRSLLLVCQSGCALRLDGLL